MFMNKKSQLPDCEKCYYRYNCPVQFRYGNAACIMLFNEGLKHFKENKKK